METTVAELIIQSLKAEGVKHIFGVSGTSVMPILDVLYHTPEIQYIQSQHEQGAGFMANGYARTARKPSICLISPQGGVTNVTTAVSQAYNSATSTIFFSVEVASHHVGKGLSMFHALDAQALLKPITKLTMRVENPDAAEESLQMAFRTASTGRKGPVHIGFPGDILRKKVEAHIPSSLEYRREGKTRGDLRDIEQAIELLMSAQRPVALADDAVSWDEAQGLLQELSERLAMPVIATYGNKGIISEEYPLSLGVAGIHSPSHVINTLQRADVVLALGCNFMEFTTAGFGYKVIPKGAKLIQVDIDPASLGKVYPLASGIVGNIDSVLADLLEALKERKDKRLPTLENSWVQEVLQRKEEWERAVAPLRASDKVPILHFRLLHDLRQALPREAVVGGTSGGTGGWFEHAFKAYGHAPYAGCWHSIGAGFPAFLGAKVALPDKIVALTCGDGGFMMYLQEIATAMAYKISCLCVVCHNNRYGNMQHTQIMRYGGRFIGTDLPIPDLAAIARDFGAYGEKVDEPGQIIPAVKRALASGKFALLDVIMDSSRENLAAPGPSMGGE